jgi:hypothetical protein
MLRIGVLLAIGACLVTATSASSAEQVRVASYCSPSGDVCYGIFRAQGQVRFKLTLAAKYFARYKICVRPAGLSATCKRFRVRKTGTSSWGGSVVWLRNFPQRGPRMYTVTWRQSGRRLGPSLTFRQPAPA